MFNMEKVGRNIAEQRKKNNMTQFELADKLGISFQAVSNWERGKSMPDISKLSLLSEIFNIPIEMILGEYSGLIESAARGDIKESFESGAITLEEVDKAACVLKPCQLDIIAGSKRIKDLSDIQALLPFLSNSVINNLALKAMKEKRYNDLNIVAPFVSQNLINEMAAELINNGENIVGIAPFISKDILNELVKKKY